VTGGVAAWLTPLHMIGGAAAILAFMVGLIIVAVFQGLRQGIRRERAVKRPCPLHPRCEDRPLTDGPGACRYRSGVISYEQAAAEAAAPAGETPPAPARCTCGVPLWERIIRHGVACPLSDQPTQERHP
jgi:hypothetical protein